MQILYQLIPTLIRWAMTLAITGGLATATLHLAKEAASSTQNGLVNLSALNHQLTGRHHFQSVRHRAQGKQ